MCLKNDTWILVWHFSIKYKINSGLRKGKLGREKWRNEDFWLSDSRIHTRMVTWRWALPDTQMGETFMLYPWNEPWGAMGKKHSQSWLKKEQIGRPSWCWVWVMEGVAILQCQHWVKGTVWLKVVMIPSIKCKQSSFMPSSGVRKAMLGRI